MCLNVLYLKMMDFEKCEIRKCSIYIYIYIYVYVQRKMHVYVYIYIYIHNKFPFASASSGKNHICVFKGVFFKEMTGMRNLILF